MCVCVCAQICRSEEEEGGGGECTSIKKGVVHFGGGVRGVTLDPFPTILIYIQFPSPPPTGKKNLLWPLWSLILGVDERLMRQVIARHLHIQEFFRRG